MKKLTNRPLILLFSYSLLILSCSEENENVINKENTIETASKLVSSNVSTAKSLFIEMMSSSDYLAYKEVLNAFVSKLNGNTINLFKDKREAMDWISVNLSKTEFASTTEFGNMLDNIETKHTTLRINNKQLFMYLSNADEIQLLEIVKPSLGTPPTITTFGDCSNACMNSASVSIDSLDAWYIGTAVVVHVQKELSYMMPIMDAIYWTRFESIISGFNDCMSEC